MKKLALFLLLALAFASPVAAQETSSPTDTASPEVAQAEESTQPVPSDNSGPDTSTSDTSAPADGPVVDHNPNTGTSDTNGSGTSDNAPGPVASSGPDTSTCNTNPCSSGTTDNPPTDNGNGGGSNNGGGSSGGGGRRNSDSSSNGSNFVDLNPILNLLAALTRPQPVIPTAIASVGASEADNAAASPVAQATSDESDDEVMTPATTNETPASPVNNEGQLAQVAGLGGLSSWIWYLLGAILLVIIGFSLYAYSKPKNA